MSELRMVEGVSGVWFYHLTNMESSATALCGARTMACGARLSSWGFKGHHGHIKYGYCDKCATLAGDELPKAMRS